MRQAMRRSGFAAKVGQKLDKYAAKVAPLLPAAGVAGIGVAAPVAAGLITRKGLDAAAEERVRAVEARIGPIRDARIRATLKAQHKRDLQKKLDRLIVKPGINRLLG